MSEKRWVQHISGQGEKWEVAANNEMVGMWILEERIGGLCPCVPKSEYRLCDPPKVWRDVTEFVLEGDIVGNYDYRRDKHDWEKNIIGVDTSKYRLRKVQLYAMARPIIDPMQREVAAFIVEQKVKS